ncbi:MAG: hypothetical protein KC544_12665 [Gemmatimonadetes bacterium]|nr:hypothetical protein [Gemmatimonadota bacterium]HPF63135.1 hypothetical protein [Gemmatimonadales bacterium]HRX19881.1 hypothetical protein [Gemmatimonadales bacterium]
MSPLRHLLLIGGLLVVPIATAAGQGGTEVGLFAEPIAGGVQLSHGVSERWRLGAAIGFGPSEGIDLQELPFRDVDPWATGYVNVAWRSRAGLEVAVSPIGAVVVIGDDFGVVYPSGQAQLSVPLGRIRVGTIVRTIRVAGANNSADWWTQWIPLRVGLTL